MHGNNKSDEELRAAAEAGALVVVDSLEEVDRAREAGATRTLIRVTPGVEADTHEHIRTGHHGSKFGLPPDDALEALRRAPETEGIHAHVGSQLMDAGAALMAVDWLVAFAARARAETGWEPRTIDLGGGLGVATAPDEPRPDIGEFVARAARRARPRLRAARPAAAAGDPRAGPLARRARRRHALHGRLGQARVRDDDLRRGRRRHLRQPAPGALRRPLHGAAREPRRRAAGRRRTPSPASTASRATC